MAEIQAICAGTTPDQPCNSTLVQEALTIGYRNSKAKRSFLIAASAVVGLVGLIAGYFSVESSVKNIQPKPAPAWISISRNTYSQLGLDDLNPNEPNRKPSTVVYQGNPVRQTINFGVIPIEPPKSSFCPTLVRDVICHYQYFSPLTSGCSWLPTMRAVMRPILKRSVREELVTNFSWYFKYPLTHNSNYWSQ